MPTRSRRSSTFVPLPAPDCYSDYMLFEMLAAHEEILVKLRRERRGLTGHDDFLAVMIDRHENDAVQIGLLIESSAPLSA
jgi:hypothetical protein